MATLVCAGLSVRVLAEAAAHAGHQAWALDLFGDTDTRAAARRWSRIGDAATLRLDGPLLLAALREAARQRDVAGWLAGSGFEPALHLLDAGAALLPLIGTAPSAQRRVRDAREFFGTLERLGAPHPAVRFDAPPDARGWLVKQMDDSGGSHIRRAESVSGPAAAPAPHRLWQRRVGGQPMSVLFVANARRSQRLAFNQLIVREAGDRPCLYHGALGPVTLPPGVARDLDALIDALAAAFELQGLCSLDFMLDTAGRWSVLELNPRPSASMALYPQARLLHLHLEACRHQRLGTAPLEGGAIAGHETVFAPAALRVPAAHAFGAGVHDTPPPGSLVGALAPLCSVSARGADAADTLARLAARRRAVLETLLPTTVKELP